MLASRFIARLSTAAGEPTSALGHQAPPVSGSFHTFIPVLFSPPHIKIPSALLGSAEIPFSSNLNFHDSPSPQPTTLEIRAAHLVT